MQARHKESERESVRCMNVPERDSAERKEGKCCWIKDRRKTWQRKGQQSRFDNFGFNRYYFVNIGFY